MDLRKHLRTDALRYVLVVLFATAIITTFGLRGFGGKLIAIPIALVIVLLVIPWRAKPAPPPPDAQSDSLRSR